MAPGSAADSRTSDARDSEFAPLDNRDFHLAAITGLRAIAASWVVLVHFRGAIEAVLPAFASARTITNAGFLGVDLFFVVSGFVICHRYLATMGERFRRKQVVEFLTLRVARLVPVHLFMLCVVGLAYWASGRMGLNSRPQGLFSPGSFAENVLLVHGWFNQRLSWNEPSWTISLEWLAYLAFPLLALLLFRVRNARNAIAAGGLLFVFAYAPIVLQGMGALHLPDFGGGVLGVGLLRILAGFVGGCAAFIVARAWQTARGGNHRYARARWSVLVSLITILFVITLARVLPSDEEGGGLGEDGHLLWLVTPLFAALVGLVGATRPRDTWLGSPLMVRAGLASYSLYMTHTIVIFVAVGICFGGVNEAFDVRAMPAVGGAAFVVGTLLACSLVAWLTWRFIEEPARRGLRRIVLGSVQALPVEERTEASPAGRRAVDRAP